MRYRPEPGTCGVRMIIIQVCRGLGVFSRQEKLNGSFGQGSYARLSNGWQGLETPLGDGLLVTLLGEGSSLLVRLCTLLC